MQNITLRSHIGADGILHLDLPIIASNMEVEINLTIKPAQIAKLFPTTRLEDGLGCLKYEGQAKSLEEMEQGIVKAARQQWFKEAKK